MCCRTKTIIFEMNSKKKDKELEQLRTLLNSKKDNITTDKRNIYNFNFTVGRSSTILGGLLACIVLFVCLFQSFILPSTIAPDNQLSEPLHTPSIFAVVPTYSRRIIEGKKIYTEMRERLNWFPHQNKSNTNMRECGYKQYYFDSRCGIDTGYTQ